MGPGQWWPVAGESALGEGQAIGADCGGHPVALYRIRGALHATDSLCTHAFVPLEDGLLDGFEIECPVHQARFDVRTGACTRFPARRPLRTFTVRVAAGRIEVWIPAGTAPAMGAHRAPGFVAARPAADADPPDGAPVRQVPP